MRTTSFFEFAGPGRVSIARFPPRGTPAGFRVYRALAPGPWFKMVDEAEYRRRFSAQLAALDGATVWRELHVLAGDAEPVLLCWERKADIDAGRTFCHRRMVAEWLERSLGVCVPEL